MSVPKLVKITKNGVEYTSGVDLCMYTIQQLTRAALRDAAKLIVKRTRAKLPKRSGRARRYTQYWVRMNPKYDEVPHAIIGYKQQGFYAGFIEEGTDTIPKQAPLYNTIMENINEIKKIEASYLSSTEDENKALSLINEEEFTGDDQEV